MILPAHRCRLPLPIWNRWFRDGTQPTRGHGMGSRLPSNLEERRVESFLSLHRSWHRWKDRRQLVELPLFPSYVFVYMTLRERLRVLELPGVAALVTFQGRPPLPELEIEALRRGLEHEIYAEPHPFLRVGHRVRVRGGSLAGTEGVLLRKKDKLRMVISLEVLMRSIAVEVDVADITSI
jgi:transcription antitermination factor NusG